MSACRLAPERFELLQRYVTDMANLKVARVNRSLCERMPEAKRLMSQGLADEAAALLEQVHASSSLAVRSVF